MQSCRVSLIDSLFNGMERWNGTMGWNEMEWNDHAKMKQAIVYSLEMVCTFATAVHAVTTKALHLGRQSEDSSSVHA